MVKPTLTLSFLIAVLLGFTPVAGQAPVPKAPLKELILHFENWEPNSRELFGGRTLPEIKNRPHYRAVFNRRGLAKSVTYFDSIETKQWTYHLLWDKKGEHSSYHIEFHVRKPLTRLHAFLFAPDVSEMRPGWIAKCAFFTDGRIKSLWVEDQSGYVFYSYQFKISHLPNSGMGITSRYFRRDSSLVGSHRLDYNQKGLLEKIRYYNKRKEIIRTLTYAYNEPPGEVILSVFNPGMTLSERRILPFSDRYRENLVVKKDRTGMSDVVKFMERTKKEDIEKLAQLIEQQYRINVDQVDTTYSPITRIEVVDTLIIKQTDTVEVVKNKRFINYGVGAGISLLAGKSFDETPLINAVAEFSVSRPYSFYFIKNINPIVSLSVLTYSKTIIPIIQGGLRQQVSVPIKIPFTTLGWKFPISFSEGVGQSPNGWAVYGGGGFPFSFHLPMRMNINAYLLSNVNGSGKLTGFIDIRYTVDLYPLFRKK